MGGPALQSFPNHFFHLIIFNTSRHHSSVELGLNASISHAIDFQLKNQPGTLYPHVQRKIQIVELNALGSRQAREQTLRHRIQIRGERANADEALAERIRRDIHVASYQVVFNNQRLARTKIPRVVERDGLRLGYLGALSTLAISLYSLSNKPTFAMCHCMRSLTIHRSQSGLQYLSEIGCFASSKTVA